MKNTGGVFLCKNSGFQDVDELPVYKMGPFDSHSRI
jgi:hypothetical protein